nr:CheR family methyltransferase [uncultured Desulfuromonas sp.]
MTTSFSPAMLKQLSGLVAEHMGILFSPPQWSVLERAFTQAADVLNCRDGTECAQRFISTPGSRKMIETMASYLTIGETYFWREPKAFYALEQEIIPQLLRCHPNDKRLRFWSVGCASGEEAFSLAILLHRMRNRMAKEWGISILATDINPRALEKARTGEYTEWSFRATPDWLKRDYFTQTTKGRYTLKKDIRDMVHFDYFNLMDEITSLHPETARVDVIMCRNVLLYFPPKATLTAVKHLHDCLHEQGWLVVGSCELSTTLFSGFETVNLPEATVYRKRPQQGLRTERDPVEDVPSTDTLRQEPSHEAELRAEPKEPVWCVPQEETIIPRQSTQTQSTAEHCRILADKGDLNEALTVADQAIRHDKLNANVHYLRAMILLEQGALEEAEQSLRRTIYLDRNLILAHFSLGNIARRQGKKSKARRHFNQTLSLLEPFSPDDEVPGSEGLSVHRLRVITRTLNKSPAEGCDHEGGDNV